MYIDIAVNITSEDMLENVDRIVSDSKKRNILPIFCGLDVASSVKCLELAKAYRTGCYLGVHPNHINDESLAECFSLEKLPYDDPSVVGIGECGLDYYRSSQKEAQKIVFTFQLSLYNKFSLPFFYHCRDAFNDFLQMAKHPGVVHSFDGTLEEAQRVLKQGFYIGINGCSMKRKENLDVIKDIPLDRILLETDSPYCLIRKSYAASEFITVKKEKYNSPVNVEQVAEVVAAIKNISKKEVEDQVFENTLKVFPKLVDIVKYWNTLSN